MKKSTNIRYSSSWIDFKCDGMFPHERIKGLDKRRLGKWSRKKFLDELEDSFDEYGEDDADEYGN